MQYHNFQGIARAAGRLRHYTVSWNGARSSSPDFPNPPRARVISSNFSLSGIPPTIVSYQINFSTAAYDPLSLLNPASGDSSFHQPVTIACTKDALSLGVLLSKNTLGFSAGRNTIDSFYV
jgi:hypothetical protein